MKEYLQLQFTMANRTLRDAGIHPVLGYVVLVALFTGVSFYLFQKSAYAPYVYVLIAVSLISRLSETRRNEFLEVCFGDKRYRLIRVAENLIVALPFMAFLCYRQQWLMLGLLPLLAALLALFNLNGQAQYTIPTPFGHKPFEFTVGFRNTFFLFIIAYGLTAIAVIVNNYNLGIFALLLAFAVMLSYYSMPEHEYYVWSYSYTPQQFLFSKFRTAMLYSTILTAPMLITLCLAYYSNAHYVLLFQLLGYAYIACMIAAKYSVYPNELNVPQAVLLALSFVFPPALIIVLPYFLSRSIARLQPLLK